MHLSSPRLCASAVNQNLTHLHQVFSFKTSSAGRMALGGGRQILGAVINHPDRPSGPPCQQGSVTGEHAEVILLAPKSTPGLAWDHPNPIAR